MNDLPHDVGSSSGANAQARNNTQGNAHSSEVVHPTSAAGSKEHEGVRVQSVEIPIEGVGVEKELPKEVSDSGVKVRPQTVPLPKSVSQMGVQEVGHNVPVPHKPVVYVPLSQEEISQGLKQGIDSSWRWFSEWCRRRLLQIGLKQQEGHD